jgi:hypothetical protein
MDIRIWDLETDGQDREKEEKQWKWMH